MIVLPAIDLKDGKCVRLRRGDFATVHQVADSAADTAAAFRAAGAKWIHMVDLDGARGGSRPNFPTIAAIAAESGLKVEMGGGVRTPADVETCLAAGIARVVIGSAAVHSPDTVREAVRRFPDQIAVGIDALDGQVKTHGWEHGAGLEAIEFAKQMEGIGVKYIVFTDIATDGMLTGPALERLDALSRAVSCRIVASGGVAGIEDIRALARMGLYGAIVGKAYYAGTIDLAAAILEGGAQEC